MDGGSSSSDKGVVLATETTEMQIDSAQGDIKSKGKIKNKKPHCFRCLTTGHKMEVCKTIICCDLCDDNDHVTKACCFMKGAPPTATPLGYAVDGLGFYCIPFTVKQNTKTDSNDALVKITEGSTPKTFTRQLEVGAGGN
jgi:hypothetical protein